MYIKLILAVSKPQPMKPQTSLEGFDWWYCCEFPLDSHQLSFSWLLALDRLAVLAEVWLNGQFLGRHHNFFRPFECDVSSCLAVTNQLVIGFRSVSSFLNQKRPRPRWKTQLINHQQLRWLRTSLLGWMPGWNPATPALGPCGEMALIPQCAKEILDSRVSSTYQNDMASISARVQLSESVDAVYLQFGEQQYSLRADNSKQPVYSLETVFENPELWWPHTHGSPFLYDVSVKVVQKGQETVYCLGKRGFRCVHLNEQDKAGFWINGQSVFLRGACWSIEDLQRFWSDKADLKQRLLLVQEAGMNMIRIGGTMQYEQEGFYELCDELGILVWQDFMFSSMDYPFADAAFLNETVQEAEYQTRRLSRHPCVAVYCGNNEVQQQAAMVGLDRANWSNDFFDSVLPDICRRLHAGTYYFASTPIGGALPFHLSQGLAHFYGVGAYKRSILDSGLDKVQFASECLAFSHVPDRKMVETLFAGAAPGCHTPRWKQGVARDSGAGWDFEDIRDYYLKALFDCDPVTLRSEDTDYYLQLSRLVPGELLSRVFGHWRSSQTPCFGALLWMFNDVVPGAGWGIVDADGNAKSTWYYAKRANSRVRSAFVDVGLDGLQISTLNETVSVQQLRLVVHLVAAPQKIVDKVEIEFSVAANSEHLVSVDELFGYFRDINFSYRFGRKQHDIVALHLYDLSDGALLSQDGYYTQGMIVPVVNKPGLEVSFIPGSRTTGELAITSDAFLQGVELQLRGVECSDNYFFVLPGVKKTIQIKSNPFPEIIKGALYACNLYSPYRIKIEGGKGG
ncbi:MAG: hypothetical protein CSA49_00170 [Gammaproteobacteria bacterium]|nr:MAG: hypothetical protein CSA49_00170 [Gammaproteobacteria bacterium]